MNQATWPEGMTTDGTCASKLALETFEVPWSDQKTISQAKRGAVARNLSKRRRHIEPATCERHYSADEVEFMNAMQVYKQSSGRMFPTWSEVLEVLGALGYRKTDGDDPQGAALQAERA
jgi:hypothetical protein